MHSQRIRSIQLVFVSTMLATAVATAEMGSDSYRFIPLQERAQGQSLTGANLLNDSVFSNPASSAFTNVYALDATFLSPKNFAASVLDTRTSEMGGGLGYTRMPVPNSDQVAQSGQLALSMKLADVLAIGATGRMLWAPDLAGNNARHTDFDLGALANFEALQIGLVTRNVAGGDPSMGVYRQTSLGARINYQQTLFFSVTALGAHNELRPDQLGFGAEYVSPYKFALKGGYRIRPSNRQSYWSAGFSVLSPKINLHYAATFPRIATEQIEHVVGATVLF